MTRESRSYRDRLYEHAIDAHGYVTVRDAAELDVPAVELRKLARRGFLDRVGHGVYRVGMIPASEHDQFAEAVEAVGPDAYLRADAVLALLNLTPVNTRVVRVGTPHRIRRTLPRELEVVREQLPASDITRYDGIRASRVERALLASQGIVMVERLDEATNRAEREGYLTASAARAVREQLHRRTAPPDTPLQVAKVAKELGVAKSAGTGTTAGGIRAAAAKGGQPT